jgi:hypothetical protein
MTIGILVQRFGDHIRDSYNSYELDAELDETAVVVAEAFPADLRHIRDHVAHHLIPLVLLARSDSDFDRQECTVIVEHCVSIARRRGAEFSDDHRGSFADYVFMFRPSLLQLDPALSALVHAPHEEIGELMRAAHDVILADGATRPEELRFFAELHADLQAVSGSSRK